MENGFTLTASFPVRAEKIYRAWISTDGHSGMTGSPARVDGRVGGGFTAWDGYIQGSFLELQENRRILQHWRTTEFPEEAEDSLVDVLLEEADGTTKLTLVHTRIPEGQDSYRQGWQDFYFKPMADFFS